MAWDIGALLEGMARYWVVSSYQNICGRKRRCRRKGNSRPLADRTVPLDNNGDWQSRWRFTGSERPRWRQEPRGNAVRGQRRAQLPQIDRSAWSSLGTVLHPSPLTPIERLHLVDSVDDRRVVCLRLKLGSPPVFGTRVCAPAVTPSIQSVHGVDALTLLPVRPDRLAAAVLAAVPGCPPCARP